MAKNEIKPVWFPESNNTIEGEKSIRTYEDGGDILTVWSVPLFNRVKLLFTGKLYLIIKNIDLPAVTILTDNPIENDKK